MKVVVWFLVEVLGFFLALGIYPIYCYFKLQLQKFYQKKYHSHLQVFNQNETNYHLKNFKSGDLLYTYLIFTIPTLAIYIRCTYIEFNESTYGLFLFCCMTILYVSIFLYVLYKVHFFYKKN
jgi:hypothetical protein